MGGSSKADQRHPAQNQLEPTVAQVLLTSSPNAAQKATQTQLHVMTLFILFLSPLLPAGPGEAPDYRFFEEVGEAGLRPQVGYLGTPCK